jgi:thiol:disulfide interchange protein
MLTRLLILLLALIAAPAQAQLLAPGEKAIAARLVAEGDAPAAGGTVTLALVMEPRAGWHGYWANPGDAGVPPTLSFTLPPGFQAAPPRYPVPQRLVIAGLMNYVYEGPYALLVPLSVPRGLAPGTRLPVNLHVDYLACTDQICVPESASVSTTLTVSANPARSTAFDAYRSALPKPLGTPARFALEGGKLRLAIPLPASVAAENPYFFPLTEDALSYAAPQSVTRNGDWLIVETAPGRTAPKALEGVLAIGENQGFSLTAAPGPVPPAGTPVAPPGEAVATPILLALLGALLGGLLLNIMPCVFPILSLKALSLARAGGEERAARSEALAYTAGVVLVCLGLGAALLALRASGEAVGWAFQLQDPRVILFLLLLVTAIALNLLGLFELPSLSSGQRLAGSGGAAGAFWTGALAAFVATPCTGPFMGAALGAALVLPSAAALAIFAGLGLGLALPFLALGFIPALRRRLPKPGPWMQRFRRILSVPMFLTALGLAWILARQTGGSGAALGLAAALVVSAALWWAGRRHGWLALAPAAAATLAAIAVLPAATAPAQARTGSLDAQPFSEARLARLRAEKRPVFVYFTADWCVTCKVNEKAVLETETVAAAFARSDTAVLVGDWTRGDPEIGRFLESHGRSGVPLYLWYAPGKDAQVLPQILTAGTVTALTR